MAIVSSGSPEKVKPAKPLSQRQEISDNTSAQERGLPAAADEIVLSVQDVRLE
jgi:hypothetical protein